MDTVTVYRPVALGLYAVADARDGILRLLEDSPDGVRIEQLLPDPEIPSEPGPRSVLRPRSAWSSTFVVSLESARQGEVVLGQGGDFQPIHVTRVSVQALAPTPCNRKASDGRAVEPRRRSNRNRLGLQAVLVHE